MSLVFFAAGLLQAGSSVLAPRLAARIGLLHTMVFTHLPSNILLMLIPLAPNLEVAIAILLLRFALSQMDVPTRQAYIAAMVDPEERTAAAAATNSARYVARPFGPLIGTLLMNNVAIGAPWVAAGALKSLYDVALWRVFSSVPLPDGHGLRADQQVVQHHQRRGVVDALHPHDAADLLIDPQAHRRRGAAQPPDLRDHARAAHLLATGHLAVGIAQPDEPLGLDRRGDPGLARRAACRSRRCGTCRPRRSAPSTGPARWRRR